MNGSVYNTTGKVVGEVVLPAKLFGSVWKENLVKQVAGAMMANMRTPVAHTKNRGEVSGTGRKPWKQKGTGRARHGSRRSPIWVGGGIAHGPRNERDYSQRINKKMRSGALFSVLSKKNSDGEVILLEGFDFKMPKTRDAKDILMSLAKVDNFKRLTAKKNAAFIAVPEKDLSIKKSFGNFGNVRVGEIKDISVVDLLKYKYVIIAKPEQAFAILERRA